MEPAGWEKQPWQKVSEPLTGRARRFMLYPFSFFELQNHTDNITLHSQLENLLRFGLYPKMKWITWKKKMVE